MEHCWKTETSTAHSRGAEADDPDDFVTMGSLINFCDALVSGGTSRKNHAEVGSGFIHFNYTPRGRYGDKATPSLIGDVTHGAFLRHPEFFWVVWEVSSGPRRAGFGSFTLAGHILRREVPPNRIVGDALRDIDMEFGSLNESPKRVLK